MSNQSWASFGEDDASSGSFSQQQQSQLNPVSFAEPNAIRPVNPFQAGGPLSGSALASLGVPQGGAPPPPVQPAAHAAHVPPMANPFASMGHSNSNPFAGIGLPVISGMGGGGGPPMVPQQPPPIPQRHPSVDGHHPAIIHTRSFDAFADVAQEQERKQRPAPAVPLRSAPPPPPPPALTPMSLFPTFGIGIDIGGGGSDASSGPPLGPPSSLPSAAPHRPPPPPPPSTTAPAAPAAAVAAPSVVVVSPGDIDDLASMFLSSRQQPQQPAVVNPAAATVATRPPPPPPSYDPAKGFPFGGPAADHHAQPQPASRPPRPPSLLHPQPPAYGSMFDGISPLAPPPGIVSSALPPPPYEEAVVPAGKAQPGGSFFPTFARASDPGECPPPPSYDEAASHPSFSLERQVSDSRPYLERSPEISHLGIAHAGTDFDDGTYRRSASGLSSGGPASGGGRPPLSRSSSMVRRNSGSGRNLLPGGGSPYALGRAGGAVAASSGIRDNLCVEVRVAFSTYHGPDALHV